MALTRSMARMAATSTTTLTAATSITTRAASTRPSTSMARRSMTATAATGSTTTTAATSTRTENTSSTTRMATTRYNSYGDYQAFNKDGIMPTCQTRPRITSATNVNSTTSMITITTRTTTVTGRIYYRLLYDLQNMKCIYIVSMQEQIFPPEKNFLNPSQGVLAYT